MNTYTNYSMRLRILFVCSLIPSLLTTTVMAGDPVRSKTATPTFRDVRLENGGLLQLTVISPSGQKLANQVVTVRFNEDLVCQSKSGVQGQIKITGLRPGLHTIQVGETLLACRLWTPDSSPPNALTNPAFVVGDSAVRGQYGPMVGAPMMPMMAPAVLATGVTATAVAVVLIGKSSGSDNDFFLPASP